MSHYMPDGVWQSKCNFIKCQNICHKICHMNCAKSKKWLKRISAVWSECLHPLVINWFIILFPKKLPNWGVHPPFLDPYYKGVTWRQRRSQQRLQLDRYDTAPSAECSRTPPWPHAANCAIPFLDLGKRVHVWYIFNHICMCWYIHARMYFTYISCDVHMCIVFWEYIGIWFSKINLMFQE